MNIFISRPTLVRPEFESPYTAFRDYLLAEGFVLRRLGGGDFSKKPPLRAVIDLISECCGAIVLGYPQIEFQHEARRSTEVQSKFHYVFPTPWNQIEGALAYACHAPIMVVGHPGISGGVFDHGITGEGVLHVDLSEPDWFQKAQFAQPYKEWLSEVITCSKTRSTSA